MKRMKHKFFAPVCAILCAAAVLLAVSFGARGLAAARERSARAEIMTYLLPGRPSDFEEEVYDGEDESIRHVYKAADGYVIEVEANGYASPLTLWVGVTNEGWVSGLTVRDHAETYGLGQRVQTDYPFLMQFLYSEGTAAVGEDVEALTGATVTSRAVTRAVNSAAAVVTGADAVSSATEWGG